MAPLWCKLQALAVVPDRVKDKISRRRWQFHKFVSNIDVRYRGGVRCPSPVECADLPTLLVNGALVFKTYPRPCLTDVHYNTPTFHLDGDLTARTQHARFKTRQVVTQVERMDPSIHPTKRRQSRHVTSTRIDRVGHKTNIMSHHLAYSPFVPLWRKPVEVHSDSCPPSRGALPAAFLHLHLHLDAPDTSTSTLTLSLTRPALSTRCTPLALFLT